VGENGRIFPDEAGCTDERELWDSIASESSNLSGTKFEFFSLRRAKNRHPLYREPSAGGGEWSFHGPYEMMGSIEFAQNDNTSTDSSETGQHKTSDAVLWISRSEMELKGAPDPKLGDVVGFWNLDGSQFSETHRKAQWDVVKASKDGNMFSSEVFVLWRLELRRKTKFLSFRKVDNDSI